MLALLLAACTSTTPNSASVSPQSNQDSLTTPSQTGRDFNLRVPPPALLTTDNVHIQPRAGEELTRAQLTFHQVLLRTPKPDYLKPAVLAPTTNPGATSQPTSHRKTTEPESAAIKCFVLGRAAYLDGDRWQAIEQLEQASRLDPNSPQILKLLGEVYFNYGNQVKGADRLAQAIRLQPDDANSLFFLGRFGFQKSQWDEVIVTLAQSATLDQREVDPAIAFLRPYYLGQALLQQGYDDAAVEQFNLYLKLPEIFGRSTRLQRELAFLDRQRGLVQVQLGDACCRLGRFDHAWTAYMGIAESDQQLVDLELLTARRIYAQLAMKQPRNAEQTLIDWLGKTSTSPRSLKLLTYLADQNGKPQRLIYSARSIYEKSGRPPTLALAIAQLLTNDKAADFLLDHLKAKPGDEAVLNELIERLAENRRDRMLAVVLEMIRRQPRSADRFAAALTSLKADTEELLTLLDKMPAVDRDSAAGFYIRGALTAAAGRMEDAAKAYDKAFATDPTFLSPQLATVRLKASFGRYDEALALLDQIAKANPSEPPSIEFRAVRAEIYAGLNRFDDSIIILDQLIAEQRREMKYWLFKARLQRDKRDYEAAERTLWAAIDVDPADEGLYAGFFDLLYDPGNYHANSTQRTALLKRVQREIPASRIARLKVAEFYLHNRAFDRAEELLKQLIKERPEDIEALADLAGLMGATDRWPEAEKLLIEQSDKSPDNVILLRLLGEVCQKLNHMPVFYSRMENYLKRQKPSFERNRQYAQLYAEWDKPEQALAALQEGLRMKPDAVSSHRLTLAVLYQRLKKSSLAMEQIDLALKEQPDKVAHILYFKSSIHSSLNEMAQSEQTLKAVLKADPDHVGANNDLGYLYAEQNRDLLDAERMTLKAVAQDGEKSAYLDSLAWVYYKLGRFEESLRRLEEARTKSDCKDDPVILDHLGDTLWRLKQPDRAVDFWKAALQSANKIEPKSRPDIEKIRAAIDGKVRALTTGTLPAVAPIASDDPAKPPPR